MKPQYDSSSLIATINKHVKLNEQEVEKLNSLIKYEVFKKNQYLSPQEMYHANIGVSPEFLSKIKNRI